MNYPRQFRRLDNGEQFTVYASETPVPHRPLADSPGEAGGSINLFTKDGMEITQNGDKWYLLDMTDPDDVEIEPVD